MLNLNLRGLMALTMAAAISLTGCKKEEAKPADGAAAAAAPAAGAGADAAAAPAPAGGSENLTKAKAMVDKMADAHFTMLWSHTIPTVETRDRNGKLARVTVIAGQFADAKAPTPPPRSWASRDDSDFAVWTIDLEAGATFTLPPALATSTRNLYAFAGATVRIAGRDVATPARVHLRADAAVDIVAGPNGAELLLLQARPISEPVAQHGPFVMNTTAEIQQAFADYRRTGFGGWPWPKDAPVHPREETRFARHANGRIERGQ